MFKGKSRLIYNRLANSYVCLFIIYIIIFWLVLMSAAVISFYHNKSNVLENYRASDIAFDDLDTLDISPVLEEGGGVQVVTLKGEVSTLGGDPMIEESYIEIDQFTQRIIEMSKDGADYKVSVSYNKQGSYWIVVYKPVGITLHMSLAINRITPRTAAYWLTIGGVWVTMFIAATWFFAKKAATTFTKPLEMLCKSTTKLAQGEYEKLDEDIFIGEFKKLSNNFNALAAKLEKEKQLREELENNKKRILLDISHDLRNPLATIMGYAENLQDGSELALEERIKYEEIIYKNSLRANARMTSLFDYTKMDSPDFKPNMLLGDICELVRRQISLFIPDFEAAGFVTEYDISEEEIFIKCDESLCCRAIDNLLSNALKYNNAGTCVKVSIKKYFDYIELMIEDDGVGFDEAMIEDIFEPFIRMDKSRNSDTGGSGLGLAITKKIIMAHGGEIKLDTGLGKGCRFTIKLYE